jgi:two-component SAPR family response regulator
MDGFELYNKMGKIDENIQICFITASSTFYKKYKSLHPEIEKGWFIQKLITINKLANIIDSILGLFVCGVVKHNAPQTECITKGYL